MRARYGSVAMVILAMKVCLATAGLAVAPAFAQSDTTSSLNNSLPSLPQISTTDLFNQSNQQGETNLGRAPGKLRLQALLTDAGPRLSRGVVWRVFTPAQNRGRPTLLSEHRNPRPVLSLPPGTYIINVAFGLAHLTRSVSIDSGRETQENFVINAGGLKIVARAAAKNFSGPLSTTYDLFADERDQFGKRRKILGNMRPGRITRLNSGIYRIVSRLGKANAIVASEVTVEAGKLTQATVIHEAAKVTFKLVQTAGGDALADAQWIIMTSSGKVIKETAGALPTHVLASGSYTISARWGGKLHTRSFAVRSGDNVEVEVVIR